MRKALYVILGIIVGQAAGAGAGGLVGLMWITLVPPDRVAGGPEAGFDIVFGCSLAGVLIGIAVGVWIALRTKSAAVQA